MEGTSFETGEHFPPWETEGNMEEFTFEDFLPFSRQEPLDMEEYVGIRESLTQLWTEGHGVWEQFAFDDFPLPSLEEPLGMDNPFQKSTTAFQQEVGAENELNDEDAKAKKERDPRCQADKEEREVLARLLYLEGLSKQAGNQARNTLFEGLVRRARETKGAANEGGDHTDDEAVPVNESSEPVPWISKLQLKNRYRFGDIKPWYSELAGRSTKAKPKRAPVLASKPSKPAQTDAPKRGRGRPRKYALDDPRSSLFRVNGPKDGIRQKKKAARNFTIHDDNEGTDGVAQSVTPDRPAARLPLTPRLNQTLPRSAGKSKVPHLATSGVRGGDPRGSRGLGFQLSRSRAKVNSVPSSEDVETEVSSEGSSSASARGSPPPPGGGGKSVRRPSIEALFYPGMRPSENEIRDDMARSRSPRLPCAEDGATKVQSPRLRTDPWLEILEYRQTYYYEGGYMEDHLG